MHLIRRLSRTNNAAVLYYEFIMLKNFRKFQYFKMFDHHYDFVYIDHDIITRTFDFNVSQNRIMYFETKILIQFVIYFFKGGGLDEFMFYLLFH